MISDLNYNKNFILFHKYVWMPPSIQVLAEYDRNCFSCLVYFFLSYYYYGYDDKKEVKRHKIFLLNCCMIDKINVYFIV